MFTKPTFKNFSVDGGKPIAADDPYKLAADYMLKGYGESPMTKHLRNYQNAVADAMIFGTSAIFYTSYDDISGVSKSGLGVADLQRGVEALRINYDDLYQLQKETKVMKEFSDNDAIRTLQQRLDYHEEKYKQFLSYQKEAAGKVKSAEAQLGYWNEQIAEKEIRIKQIKAALKKLGAGPAKEVEA